MEGKQNGMFMPVIGMEEGGGGRGDENLLFILKQA